MNDNEQEAIPVELEQRIRSVVPIGPHDNGGDLGESYPAPPLPSDERGGASSADYPLRIQREGDGITVQSGLVGGFAVVETSSGTISSTSYVSVVVSVGYDSGTGVWSATGATTVIGAAYSTPNAAQLVVQVGVATYSAGQITITQVCGGNQWIARTGSLSTYVDANGSLSPLYP